MNSLSNHFYKGRFFNPQRRKDKRNVLHVLLWMLGSYDAPDEFQAPPADFVFPESKDERVSNESVLWIGHSTFLIQAWGKSFLTDPVWSERASPVRFLGPKREYPPGLSFERLPPIDYVLISHNHYDHLDLRTIRKLVMKFPKVIFFVPLGLKKWFQQRHIENVIELDWWQQKVHESLSITCLPAQHFSNRGLLDRNKTLWCGWMVESKEKRFYFVGDTSYNPVDFQEIGKRFQPIDLCLIPIGCYQPRAFMSPVHLSPEEAVLLHQELGSKLSIASHFGTFKLSKEPLNLAPYELYKAIQQRGIDPQHFKVPKLGQKLAW